MVAVAFVLLYGGGVAAGMIVLKHEQLRDKGAFHVAVLLWCLLMGALFHYASGAMTPDSIFGVMPAGLLYGPCFAYFFSVWFMRVRTWGVSDHKLKVEPTFDQAEAAEKRGDMPAALRLYQSAAQGSPGHAETRRRLGEAYLKSGDADSGIAEMRTALGMIEDPEKKMVLAFRVVDLLIERKADTFNSDLILRELERDYSGSRVGELAKARRGRLAQPRG
jgi:tetratricopeptide (TPR) repeat protein